MNVVAGLFAHEDVLEDLADDPRTSAAASSMRSDNAYLASIALDFGKQRKHAYLL